MKAKLIAGLILINFFTACCAQPQEDNGSESATDPTIAVVYDKEILMSEKNNLVGIIFGTLLEKYANEHNIEPTQEEIDAFVKSLEKVKLKNIEESEKNQDDILRKLQLKELTESERKSLTSRLELLDRLLKSDLEVLKFRQENPEKARKMHEETAKIVIRAWKTNKALFEQYGGRVIFQQAGPEPLDAYRKFLKEEEQKGSFKILDKSFTETFWKYFTNENMHTFISKNRDEGAKIFETPWWLLDKEIR